MSEKSPSPTVDVDFLSRVPIFSSVSRKDLTKLAGLWKPTVRLKGQAIFQKGDPPRAMYVIREGKVAISVWTEENLELVLSMLGKGDFFGELALLDGSLRTATAKVVEQADLLEMTQGDFLKFLRGKPEVALSVMAVIAQRLRTTNELIERRTARNVNEEVEQQTRFRDRVADRLAQWGGSWSFIFVFLILLATWIIINTIAFVFGPFDPFPFVFLNLVLGCVAAIQAPVIMMSQNRQSQKDRLRADLDYQVDLKAELQIQSLHVKLDEIRASEIRELRELQQEQMAMLRQQIELLNERLLAQK